jgi:hypothetical protein
VLTQKGLKSKVEAIQTVRFKWIALTQKENWSAIKSENAVDDLVFLSRKTKSNNKRWVEWRILIKLWRIQFFAWQVNAHEFEWKFDENQIGERGDK